MDRLDIRLVGLGFGSATFVARERVRQTLLRSLLKCVAESESTGKQTSFEIERRPTRAGDRIERSVKYPTFRF